MAAASSYGHSTEEEQKDSFGEACISHEGAIYPSRQERFSPYLAEFVGVFILTLTCLLAFSEMKLTGEHSGWITNAYGFMVCSLVYSLGHISGGHLNPSVSISLALTGRLPGWTAMNLIIAQTLGAATAGVVRLQFSNSVADLGPMEGHTWTAVITVETLYTALLCFVYLNCAASIQNNPVSRQNGFTGLCMGFCFIAGSFATRDISYTVMNSAVAVGLGVVESQTVGGSQGRAVIYFLTDILGAFIGTGLYRVVRPDEAHFSRIIRLGRQVEKDDNIAARIAAEFIGTFFVILTKALNRLAWTDVNTTAGLGPEAWSVMAIITALTYSLGGVSGAHFNPALTLGVLVSGQGHLRGYIWVFYILAQSLAACVAASLFASMAGGRTIPMVPSSFSEGTEAICEGTLTALLTYVVLSCRKDYGNAWEESDKDCSLKHPPKRRGNFHGLAYGVCHVVGGFSIGPITGSMLNPAVVFSFVGFDILHGELANAGLTAYIIYQVCGALVGAVIFMILHAELYRDEELCKDGDGEDEEKDVRMA